MFALIFCCGLAACSPASAGPRLPNIIHFVADDVGYDDLACFGSRRIKTPCLDALAKRGMRLTNYYGPAPLCSASRAALMTGCYAERVGIPGALMPHSKRGLSHQETTVAEVLKARGYATALVGKWHLGHRVDFLPTRHGFDHFFGLPYPNDQGAERNLSSGSDPPRPPIPVYRGEEIVEHSADLENLPLRMLNDALSFIDRNQQAPFYLHYANIETHIPWFLPSVHQGKSQAGPYGDAVEFMDWTVGQLYAFLQSRRLDEDTLFVFSSDNGMVVHRSPDYETSYGRFGAVDETTPHRLRGGKNTVWEGGVRVPCVVAWPGKIAAGAESAALCAGFDWYATFAAIAGATLPSDRIIDGQNLSPVLTGVVGAKSPHEHLFYYHSFRLGAVRQGPWKLLFAPNGRGVDRPNVLVGDAGKPRLYNLESDPAESTDVASQNPAIVARLQALSEEARNALGDSSQGRVGKEQRDPGRVP